MTSPRFRIINPAAGGVLVADRAAPSIHYRGRATLIATVQPSGSATSLVGRVAGYSHFQFTSSTPVFPAIQLPSGCVVGYDGGHDVARVGDVWNIWVYCANSTVDANGFATQVAPEVYMFGPASGAASGIGLRLRDDAGNLTHAYTDAGPIPMWFRSRISLPASTPDLSTPRAIASFTKPAAVGWPMHLTTTENWLSTTTMLGYEWTYGWRWDSASPDQLMLAEIKSFQYRDNAAGPPRGTDQTFYDLRASETLVLDASLFT